MARRCFWNGKRLKMNRFYYLKLRTNIILDGDIDLAEREIKSFFRIIERVSNPAEVETKIGLTTYLSALNTRNKGCIGFFACDTTLSNEMLVRLLNFIQEIWLAKPSNTTLELLNNSERWSYMVKSNGRDFICLLPFMACAELLAQNKFTESNVADIQCLTAYLAGSKDIKLKTIKAPTTGVTSTQHVHSLHKYKAKFFPRLIRSFFVTYYSVLPKDTYNKILLLDPFVGSGTALVEAALLGIDCVGIDIDNLSCSISEAKLKALKIAPARVASSVNELIKTATKETSYKTRYKFPRKIIQKFERWGAIDEQFEYEGIITKWTNAISGIKDNETRQLLWICLSDALTRKFVIRMMGTGVGRFALEIAKTSLETLIISNLRSLTKSCYDAQSLIEAYKISLGKGTVHHGTALSMPYADNSFSVIITSPPYLPASSGREDYLVGKAVSCLALNLMSDDEIEAVETGSVGSMKWSIENCEGLPISVYELHDWLLSDPLRKIKAKPVLAYYMSLKKALKESFRVLMNNGLAIFVIGKESVFYKFSSREVLYKVECDKIFADIAMSAGFKIEDQINVELDKKNMNARPRSLDSYYETVFILKKNQTANILINKD